MSRLTLSQIMLLPDDIPLPVSVLRGAIAEAKQELKSVAVQRELTLQMWEDICTDHLCEDDQPWETNPQPATDGHGRTSSAPEA